MGEGTPDRHLKKMAFHGLYWLLASIPLGGVKNESHNTLVRNRLHTRRLRPCEIFTFLSCLRIIQSHSPATDLVSHRLLTRFKLFAWHSTTVLLHSQTTPIPVILQRDWIVMLFPKKRARRGSSRPIINFSPPTGQAN